MVKATRRPALLLTAFIVVIAVACGGGGEAKSTAASPTPRSQPTRNAPAQTGPSASVDPRSGPPGTQVTVSGSGWAPRSPVTVAAASSSSPQPYASVTTTDDGSFTARFRLEKAPDGSDLKIGRFDLVARAAGTEIMLPFQIEVARPVRNPGDGGG